VMVTVGLDDAGSVRIDGWIDAPDGAGRLRVELRGSSSPREETADDDGRFSFDGVPPGLVQFAFHAPDGEPARLPRSVVTPSIEL